MADTPSQENISPNPAMIDPLGPGTLFKSPFGATPMPTPKTTSMYDDPELAPLRTLKSDISTALREENMSLARIAIKEDAVRQKEIQVEKHNTRVSALTIVASLFFIIGGLSLVGYLVLFVFKEEPTAPLEAQLPEALIPADIDIAITNIDQPVEWYLEAITEEIPRPNLRTGFVKNMVILEGAMDPGAPARILNVGELLPILFPSIPDRLTRLIEDDYMLGAHTFDEQTGFLILKTGSYAGALSEFLSWEPAMEAAIVPVLAPARAARVSTTTPVWTDAVMENIDVRVLRDGDAGSVILMYSFMGTRGTLFVGANENTFKEILRRKNAPRKAR